MKKGQIKHTIKPASQSVDQWVGLNKQKLTKVTAEIPSDLHKKLLLASASKSSKDNRIYIRDILVEALEQYFVKNPVKG